MGGRISEGSIAWYGSAGACDQNIRDNRKGLSKSLAKTNLNFYPVILAGGRGTRFWPLSRKRRAKQLLALDGKQTMIQQTVARLLPLAPAKRFWTITNEDSQREIARQIPRLG